MQHFLLSAAARTLSLRSIYRMSDDEAFEAFKAIRFSENGGEAFWPRVRMLRSLLPRQPPQVEVPGLRQAVLPDFGHHLRLPQDGAC